MFHAAACGAREWLSLVLKRARRPLRTDKHVRALYSHTSPTSMPYNSFCEDRVI